MGEQKTFAPLQVFKHHWRITTGGFTLVSEAVARIGMGKRIYGAVTQMDESGEFITIEGERVPKKWSDTENEVKKLREFR